MLFKALSDNGIPALNAALTKGSEKLSAANADPIKPESVIATCIVARKHDGSLVSLFSLNARLSPPAAIFPA